MMGQYKVWFHGTTAKNAKQILKDKCFKKDTWFAAHLEDAIEFGGNHIFYVIIKFDKTSLKWQVRNLNKISTDRIWQYKIFTQKIIIKDEKVRNKFFGIEQLTARGGMK